MFNEYFSAKHIKQKGALLNLVVSDRSDGKTFDIKLRTLSKYYHNNEITVICRRYKTEMTKLFFNDFFGEVFNKNEIKGLEEAELTLEQLNEIKSWKFRYTKDYAEVSKDGKTWDIISIFTPLSMSGKKKSMFNDYCHRIFEIDCDEYIPLDNRYLPDEADLLLELYKSVDRDRYSTQMFLFGNKITPFIPLLDYFNIEVGLTQDKIRMYRNGSFAVQIYSSKEHRTERKESKFSDLIKGTRYEGYDIGEVMKAYNIKMKSKKGFDCWLSFKSELGEGTIWYKDGEYVVSNYTRKDKPFLVDKTYNTNREEYNIKLGLLGKNIKIAYYTGKLYFESESAYHKFEPIFKLA